VSATTATFEGLQEALFQSTSAVFSTMAHMPIVKIDPETIAVQSGMSAIVGFGGRLQGFVAVHLPAAAACQVATNMLGMEVHEMDDVVRDAIGEIGNMMAGGFKKTMSETFGLSPIQISIPTVVNGQGYTTNGPSGTKSAVIGAMSDDHQFKIQLVAEQP